MKCKHKNTRKLFWSNSNPNKWMKTSVSICLDCGEILKLKKIGIRNE